MQKKQSHRPIESCPKCNQGKLFDHGSAFECDRWREGCDFKIWRTIAQKRLSKNQVRQLLRTGTTDLIQGFKSRKGTLFAAELALDDMFQVVFKFPEQAVTLELDTKELGPCPCCEEGSIVESKKGFGCNRWREGCQFVIWKIVAQRPISPETAEELLINGQTSLLDGFVNRKGEAFSACLVIDHRGKVTFAKPGY